MTHSTTAPVAAGGCPDCGFMVAVATTDQAGLETRCPQCGTRIRLTFVIGSHNERIPCDDRCQYATKDHCSCSCEGANHRAGYIHVDLVPAFIRQRDANRHAAKKARAAERAAKVRQTAADQLAAQVEAHPELTRLLGEEYADLGFGFARDMRDHMTQGEPFTPGQLEAAVRMVQQDAAKWERQAQRDADEAAARATGVTVPTGAATFTGTIAIVKTQSGYAGREEVKMLVVTDQGWKVWGTAPRSIAYPAGPYNHLGLVAHREALRDRRVTVTATVEPSADDQLFGFMKRPKVTLFDQPADLTDVA